MKKCAQCRVIQPSENFSKDNRKKDGKDSYCRSCKAGKRQAIPREKQQQYQNAWRARNVERVRQKNREQYAANPERKREIQRNYRERHRETKAGEWSEARRRVTLAQYGLTPESYQGLLLSQGNACAICRSEDPQHWSGRFQVDHDHVSGEVRGLLCAPCNGGVGLLRDDPERILAALLYLLKGSSDVAAQIVSFERVPNN